MYPKIIISNLDDMNAILAVMEEEHVSQFDTPLDPLCAIEQINAMIEELVGRIDDLIDLAIEYKTMARIGKTHDWRLTLADRLSSVIGRCANDNQNSSLINITIINMSGDVYLKFV